MEFDSIYKNAKPEIVKVLLIGESPPIQKENFFYIQNNHNSNKNLLN